jgi:membrane protease YdiL (CAAX protease family)
MKRSLETSPAAHELLRYVVQNNMNSHQDKSKAKLIIASLYAITVILVGSYFNFNKPYSPDPVTTSTPIQIILWSLLYIPIFFIPLFSNWKITNMGFSFNRRILIALIPVVLLCGPIAINFNQVYETTLLSNISEAFARTGEELFFRGFLILFITKLLKKNDKAFIWAALFSSIIFAGIHTQTFQANYFQDSSSSQVYLILERFLNLTLAGVFFAILRIWSHSIIPSVVAHSILNGGPFTLPFSITIYIFIVLFAFILGEDVFHQSNQALSGFEKTT